MRLLARYRVAGAWRLVACEAFGERLRILDLPAAGKGPPLVVEEGFDLALDGPGALEALVGDYSGRYSVPYVAGWAQAAPLAALERAAGLVDRIAGRLEGALLQDTGACGA